MTAEQIAALARIVHFACVHIDGEYALRHQPQDHESALAVALDHADRADIAALAARPAPEPLDRDDVDWIADVQRRFGLDDSATTAQVWKAHERAVEEAEAEGYARGRLLHGLERGRREGQG